MQNPSNFFHARLTKGCPVTERLQYAPPSQSMQLLNGGRMEEKTLTVNAQTYGFWFMP
jgi:hypothetical protein